MRGADGGPWRRICALPAFWVGLLYDGASLDAAWDLCRDWTAEERDRLRHDAGKLGLRAEIRGRPLREVAARGAGDRRGRAQGARPAGRRRA